MNVHVDDIKCEFSSDFSRHAADRDSISHRHLIHFFLYSSSSMIPRFQKCFFPANTVCRHLDKSPRDSHYILDFDIVFLFSFHPKFLIMNIINFNFWR